MLKWNKAKTVKGKEELMQDLGSYVVEVRAYKVFITSTDVENSFRKDLEIVEREPLFTEFHTVEVSGSKTNMMYDVLRQVEKAHGFGEGNISDQPFKDPTGTAWFDIYKQSDTITKDGKTGAYYIMLVQDYAF